MGKRKYPAAVEKALFVLSRGYCYAPTCKNAVFEIDADGDPCIIVEIAHICGYPNGPRYDDELYRSGRVDHWSNLILLCKPHHDKVDGAETRKRYPPDLLHSWKNKREKGLQGSLQGMGKVTPDQVRQIFVEVVTDTRERILADTRELISISRVTADLVQLLVDEAYSRPVLDPNTVSALEDAARTLQLAENAPLMLESARSLQLPEYAVLMHQAGRELQLPDYAWMVHQAGRELQLPDYAPLLASAADKWQGISDKVAAFNAAVDRLAALGGTVGEIDRAAVYVSEAAARIHAQKNVVTDLKQVVQDLVYQRQKGVPSDRWRYFWAGTGVGVVSIIALFGFFWFGTN